MSTIAISSLPVATTGLVGDVFPIVQSNVTKQITNANLFNSVTNLTASGSIVAATVNGVMLGIGTGNHATNTAIGNDALIANTTALSNTAIGVNTLNKTTTGSNNTAVGSGALITNISGAQNTGVGASALSAVTGSYNTAVGRNSGGEISTGTKNTIIGTFSGNGSGLDIRTLSNYIVLSDGDAIPRAYWNGADATFNGGLTLTGTLIAPTFSITDVVATNVTTSAFTAMSGGVNTIASASGITPTKQITYISGTAAIVTINSQPPLTANNGTIILIPTGAFTWTTAGNIAVAGTAVVGRALHMTYVSGNAKWYPSYV